MSEELWGVIEENQWRDVPFLQGRSATEQDVKEERAVFYLQCYKREPIGNPHNIRLPFVAMLDESQEEGGSLIPVVMIQVEENAGQTVAGYRFFNGGNGVCLLEELQPIEDFDEVSL